MREVKQAELRAEFPELPGDLDLWIGDGWLTALRDRQGKVYWMATVK